MGTEGMELTYLIQVVVGVALRTGKVFYALVRVCGGVRRWFGLLAAVEAVDVSAAQDRHGFIFCRKLCSWRCRQPGGVVVIPGGEDVCIFVLSRYVGGIARMLARIKGLEMIRESRRGFGRGRHCAGAEPQTFSIPLAWL